MDDTARQERTPPPQIGTARPGLAVAVNTLILIGQLAVGVPIAVGLLLLTWVVVPVVWRNQIRPDTRSGLSTAGVEDPAVDGLHIQRDGRR